MVNISKIKTLAKKQGTKLVYICEQLGVKGSYLSDIERGKTTMSEERIRKVAEILGTTYEYLTDQTDDPLPTPAQLADMAESLEERIVHEVMYKLAEMPEEQKETLSSLLKLPDEEFKRAMDMFNIMWRK